VLEAFRFVLFERILNAATPFILNRRSLRVREAVSMPFRVAASARFMVRLGRANH
jgi:hypothetical protein